MLDLKIKAETFSRLPFSEDLDGAVTY